jgi:hypothetical protein
MKNFIIATTIATSCFLSSYSANAEPEKLIVSSKSIENGKPIADKFAFCAPDGAGKTKNSANISPEINWSGAPASTKSFAIVVVDPDVPAKFDDANKDGKTIAADFPRQNFYHWVQIDIPANVTKIAEGEGKKSTSGVALINNFASFMKDKPATDFTGYDGPCPPWNDTRIHNYHFTVYALDVAKLGTKPTDDASKTAAEIEKHAISKGELIGTFSNYKAGN